MKTRVLIVDDSPSIQKLLTVVLSSDPQIEVLGCASNPHEARSMIKELNPDVITLDVEMPGMTGIEFLEKIMKLRPMPVVMISTLTQKGAQISMEALQIGAFCCLPKPRIDNEIALQEICIMVKQAAAASESIKRKATQAKAPAPKIASTIGAPDLILVGSSTGGVEALTQLFSGFPKDCPPTVVTQHMPPSFTKSLAERLDTMSAPCVKEARHDEPIEQGHIYIAPGGIGHTVIAGREALRTRIEQSEKCFGHMPAVDRLFGSAAHATGKRINAALLTGMGTDGAKGMMELRKRGARTIAQDEETSLVYGMPAAAAKIGAAEQVLPLGQIAAALFNS